MNFSALSAFPIVLPPVNLLWEKVLHLGIRRKYRAREIISRGDVVPDGLMYIQSGRVRCGHPGAAGNFRIYFYAEAGTIFGEALVICQEPTVASFTACEDTVVYVFSMDTLQRKIIPAYPDLAFNLMKIMAHKIRIYSLHLESITLNDVCGQICRICYSLLLEKGELERKPGIFQQELAEILGVHRNTIIRAIQRLKKDGIIIEFSRRKLQVSSFEAVLKRSLGDF